MSNRGSESKIVAVAKKELFTYFSSPIAFIFLGTFLVVSMFIFFWVETFFARNIVDVRPLFEWMPILLIFLVAALTMKMWSEEQRMGTIEFLLTVPVKTHRLVLGKFFACLGLVSIALILTLGVPITVSMMGELDPGPVVGAYIAAVLLAGAYTAIGLYMSSRTDNQIVSLMLTILTCFAVYLIGSRTLTALVGYHWGEIFQLLGSGSRFESITRGVIDIRDLYYYLCLTGIFLTLNVFSLEKLKWSCEKKETTEHKFWGAAIALIVANLFAANFWLHNVTAFRADLTSGNMYTISEATEGLLEQLQEPLLIRGYFSAKTHPLLAPLVPRLRDLVKEYEVMSGGKVRSEFIDPRENPELEEEANRKYSIKPIPLQIADKYQAALVNSYFDILIKYGDKYEVLGFRDLIELKAGADGDLEVQLRNPEYDITRSIKKVLYGFQSVDNLFASLKNPVKFIGYISDQSKLPGGLAEFSGVVKKVLEELQKSSEGKFEFSFQDPNAEGGKLAKEIGENYGFRAIPLNFLDPSAGSFYFYMILLGDNKIIQVPIPENATEEGARKTIVGGLKRFSPGFLRNVGLVTPPAPPPQNPYMRQFGGDRGKRFQLLQQKLGENHTVRTLDLQSGIVPEDIDMLMLVAPKDLNEKQLFAVDQFLMKGGTVLVATAPYSIERSPQGIDAAFQTSGLEDWLKLYGIELQKRLILDPQNEAYPVPRRRPLGGFTVEEIQLLPYPHFVDVRGSGMNEESTVTAGIPQVTINWPSPLMVDPEVNKERNVVKLLESSSRSWSTPSTTVQPNLDLYPGIGFPQDGEEQAYQIAAVIEGTFESYFKDKKSPLAQEPKADETDEGSKSEESQEGGADKEEEKEKEIQRGIIDKSPESSRIFVIASNEFLEDQTLRVSSITGSDRFLNSIRLIENAIDWALEDRALLSIRSRGHFSRTLVPMTDAKRAFWESLNYALVLFGLAIVYLGYRIGRSRQEARYKAILNA
jgi:ABC-2 type transport system permease protein